MSERLFSSEMKDLTFDFAGEGHPQQPRRVLMVAMRQGRLEQVIQMCDAAGLRVESVTSSTLALASVIHGRSDEAMALLVTGGSAKPQAQAAELLVSEQGSPLVLKYVPMGQGSVAMGQVGAEVHRALSMLPQNASQQQRHELYIWNGADLADDAINAFSQRVGLPVKVNGAWERLHVAQAGEDTGGAGQFGSAVALAILGLRRERAGIDLLHSRLAPPVRARWNRPGIWAAGVAALVVAGILWLWFDVRATQADLADLNQQRQAMQSTMDAAQRLADRATFASGWFDARPHYLGFLRALTQAFPDEGTIWVTSLLMRENGKGTVTGKATDQQQVLAVLDRLKTVPALEVKLIEVREAGGSSRDQIFSISFTYNGPE
jgi:hypothetical protein